MSTRWSWGAVLKELAGAQSTLGRANVRHRRADGDWHDAMVGKARLELAAVIRTVRALRRGAKAKTRRAA